MRDNVIIMTWVDRKEMKEMLFSNDSQLTRFCIWCEMDTHFF